MRVEALTSADTSVARGGMGYLGNFPLSYSREGYRNTPCHPVPATFSSHIRGLRLGGQP